MANIRKKSINKPKEAVSNIDSALVEHVQGFLQNMSLPFANLCLGLSGGVDSVVLLHILALCQKILPFQLSAVHVNHGIHVNAQQWAGFAQAYAASMGVECAVHEVQLAKKGGDSLEAVARRARYAIYQRMDCDAIILAHHQDDQAETVLLQLLRGSGVVGLAAMPKKRRLQNNQYLLRPLLDVSRERLLAYASAHQLKWVEDDSNIDTRFRRNFLRHDIVPMLQQHYPKVTHTLSRSAHYFSETGELLAELAEQDCPQIKNLTPLPQTALLPLSDVRQRNVLYWYLRAHGLFPDEKWVIEIQKTMHIASKASRPSFVLQGKELYFAYDRLFVVPAFNPPGEVMSLQWRGETKIAVHEWRGTLHFIEKKGRGLSTRILRESPLMLKSRQGGERLKQAVNRPSHAIKHLWQEAKVSFWQRQRVPLIWLDGKLLMVPGVGMACELNVDQEEVGISVHWCPWDFDLNPGLLIL